MRQARLISGDSGLMVCVVGSRWILGYHGVLLQEVTQKSLRNLRYCNHNFYFVGSTSECNLGVIRVYYVSNSTLFVLKQHATYSSSRGSTIIELIMIRFYYH